MRRSVFFSLACLVGLQPSLGAAPAGASLVPGNSKLHLSVPNFARLEKSWKRTKVSELFADPKLKPFFDDVVKDSMFSKLALEWDDIRSVAKGEMSFSIFPVGPRTAAHVMTLDTNNEKIALMKLLDKVVRSMEKQRYTVAVKEIAGFPVTTYTRAAAAKKGAPFVFSFVKDGILVAGDNQAAAAAVLKRWGGKAADRLDQQKAFQETMARAKAKIKGPWELAFFLEPLGLAQIERAAATEPRYRRGPDILRILDGEGFSAFRGIGGYLSFGQGDYDIVQHTAIYAPGPYKKSMRMVKTLPGDNFAPPDWVPADATRLVTAYVDVANAYANFGSFFDAYYGEGDAGTFADIIKGLRDDPNGPQIDVAKDLIGRLGNRATIVVDDKMPAGPFSVRSLVAVQTRDEKGVAEAIRRLMENDETIKKHDLSGGVVLWEMLAQVKKRKGSQPAKTEAKAPNTAIAVARGQLILASDVKMLEEILTGKRPSLAGSADYQRVAKELAALGAAKDCLRSFARADEDFRTVYELVRTHRLEDARSIYGQILMHLLGDNFKQVDTSKFPEYDRFRRYLGSMGFYCVQDESGWTLIGCAPRKQ